jgi:hypothetical protein
MSPEDNVVKTASLKQKYLRQVHRFMKLWTPEVGRTIEEAVRNSPAVSCVFASAQRTQKQLRARGLERNLVGRGWCKPVRGKDDSKMA